MLGRITRLVVLVAVLAAGAWFGRSFLAARTAPHAPVQVVKPAPDKTDKGEGQQSIQQTEDPAQYRDNNSPPQNGVPADGTGGESQIDIEYLAQLNKIGQYYQGQLNALVAQAYNSYLAVKEGKSNASLLSLADKYVEEGQTLEKQSDARFYSVLDQYRAALQKAGLPTTYEEQAKNEYAAAKAAERQKILSAAEQYLK